MMDSVAPLPALTDLPGLDARGRALRHDGWTGARQRQFLQRLGECLSVVEAARSVEMSERSAYNLRNREGGLAFRLAWDAALDKLARPRLAQAIHSRVIDGEYETIERDGQVAYRRHRYDNRLAVAMLTRLDTRAKDQSQESQVFSIIAADFERFLDVVAAGGEGLGEFFAARRKQFTYSMDADAVIDRLRGAPAQVAGQPPASQ